MGREGKENMTYRTIFAILLSLSFVCMCAKKEKPANNLVSEADLGARLPFEGRIVFHSNFDGDNEIYLLTKTRIEKLTDNSWNDEYPVWSPDGNAIAFTSDREGTYDIFKMKPDGTDIVQLTSSPAQEKEPSWYPDGTAVAYTSETKKFLRKQLMLKRVDIHTKETRRIIPGYSKGHAIPDVSPTGELLTFTAKRTIGWEAALYSAGNKKVTFLDEGGKSCRARFSRDGKKLAYVSSKADGKGDIWIMNPDGSEKTRLTERDDTYDYFPSWSPDDRHIVFNSSRQHDHNGDWQLYVIDVQTLKTALLFDSPGNDVFPDWAPSLN
jgi:Tol biopolymer transport system component